MVLDRPEIPLHTNGSENDIRCHVTRRKVSAGTRSDIGRDCRDAFLGLAKTCAKLSWRPPHCSQTGFFFVHRGRSDQLSESNHTPPGPIRVALPTGAG